MASLMRLRKFAVAKNNSVAETVTGAKTFSGTTTISGALVASGGFTPTGSVDLSGATVELPVSLVKTTSVTLTNAQMLALRATPITVVAAPGAGKWTQILAGVAIFNYTAAYTESADNMALRYVDGSGSKASADIECTGFITASGDAITNISPLAQLSTSPLTAAGEISNAAVVIHNIGDGEWGGGDAANTVKIIVHYVTHTTGL